MSYRTIILTALLVAMALVSCRKQYHATEEDLANYGWELFESGDYSESNQWFIESIGEDSTYKDGYNGIGWSFGKMRDLESSVIYFHQGLQYEQDPNIVANTRREILAGLCFAYNALGNDSLAIIWGDTLTGNWTENTSWSFSHDTTITHLDVYITLSASYFSEGDFENSLSRVQLIYSILSPDTTFNTDVTTVNGRYALAEEIEFLQTLLQVP